MKRKLNNDKTILRVAIYVRVSTEQQAEDGDSIRDQLNSCEAYIKAHENMILAGEYIDGGISGQKTKREDFQKLLSDVRANLIDLIIFTRLDRWFRSLRHYLNTQEVLDKHNVSWTAIRQPFFDTSTAQGRTFVNTSMAFAELEAQNASERIKGVFKDKVSHSEVISGRTPIGYSIVDKHLVPDKDAPIVVAIFEHYQAHSSMGETLRYMQDAFGIVRSRSSLKRMLQNKKYIGIFRDNESYCEPIITKELFYDVQRLLKLNIKTCKNRHDYIFSGLIRCVDCGYVMSAASNHNHYVRKSGEEVDHFYSVYRCHANRLHRCVNNKVFFESSIEKELLKRVRPELEQYICDYKLETAPVVQNKARIHKLQTKLSKLKELYLNELITLEEFRTDKADFEHQIEELQKEEQKPVKDLSSLEEFLKLDFENIYSSFTAPEKRRVWRSIIKEIQVDHHKNINIVFL